MIRKLALVGACALAALGTAGSALADAPASTSPPAIAIGSYVHVGYTLTATKGTWPGTGLSFKYQWKQCDGEGASCVDIATATGLTYKPSVGDASKRLKFAVTATNAAKQSTTATTVASSVVGNSVPQNTGAPAVTAPYLHVGYAISASTGSWDAPKPGIAYQWQRCWADATHCVDIAKATSASYIPVVADAFGKLKVGVKATNLIKQTSDFTYSAATTGAIGNFGPQNTSAPTISAPYLHVGYAVTAAAGSWDAPNATLAYQWQRCDDEGVGCVDIVKATAATYKLVGADAGKKLRVGVRATNLIKQVSPFHYSEAGAIVSAAAPLNTGVPSITAPFLHIGYVVTASPGSWDAPNAAFKYQWQRCDLEVPCVNIAGATAASYKPVSADAHRQLRIGVTAVNAAGTAGDPAFSSRTDLVGNDLPEIVEEATPTTGGYEHVGYTLTATGTGTWDTPGLKFTYEWWRCNLHCAPIAGAKSATYKLQGADNNSYIGLLVYATNAANQTNTAGSNLIGPVTNNAPHGDLVLEGDAVIGGTVSVDADWDTPGVTLAVQWRRCDAEGAACVNIAGATSRSYTLVAADAGKTLRAIVKATNLVKQATTITSDRTDVAVTATAPAFTIGAQIQLSPPHVGDDLYAYIDAEGDDGMTGSPEPRLGFQWYSCPAEAEDASDCTPIEDATDNVYTVVESDLGTTLRVKVTATNVAGSASSTSDATDAVVAALPTPENITPPTVEGERYVGASLSVGYGTWSGEPSWFEYRWQICDSPEDLASCRDIAEEIGPSIVVGDYAGKYIRVGLVAGNYKGDQSAEVFSAAGLIAAEAAPHDPPVQTGGALVVSNQSPFVGGTLNVSDEITWDQSTTDAIYAWQRCDVQGDDSSCHFVGNGTAYEVTSDDVGGYLRASVAVFGTWGESEMVFSPMTDAVVFPA